MNNYKILYVTKPLIDCVRTCYVDDAESEQEAVNVLKCKLLREEIEIEEILLVELNGQAKV